MSTLQITTFSKKISFFAFVFLFSLLSCQSDEEEPILEACFTPPSELTKDTPLAFDASCSLGAESYLWDFGDGENASIVNPQHTYKSTGQFTVKLRVQSKTSKDSVMQQITISPVFVLKACFTLPSSTMNTPLAFDASCSVGAESYFWDFGDGENASIVNPQHTYKSTGQFNVKLRVHSKTSKDSVMQQVTIISRTEESDCLPEYILPIGEELWPHKGYDSVVFSYYPDNKLQDIKWFISNKALIASHRVQFIYNTDDELVEMQLKSLTAVNPTAEKLESTFFVHNNSNRLPDKINWIRENGDSLRSSTFTYDGNGRLSQIRNWWIQKANGFHNTRYEYGDGNNPIKVFFTLKPGNYYPETVARVNTSFDTSAPFYSATKELKIYFEYVIQIEPYLNNYKSSRLHQSMTPFGSYTFWGGGPWFQTEGAAEDFEIKLNDKLLVTYLNPHWTSEGPQSEIRFSRAGYTCK